MLWLYTIFLCSKVTTKVDLLCAPLRSRFSVVTRKEVTEPWICVVLEKARKWTWDVLDEMGDDQIKTVDCKEDTGPLAEWDMLYQSPTEGDMHAAVLESQRNLQDQVIIVNKIDKSPRRKAAASCLLTSLSPPPPPPLSRLPAGCRVNASAYCPLPHLVLSAVILLAAASSSSILFCLSSSPVSCNASHRCHNHPGLLSHVLSPNTILPSPGC
jgi:hypothetical protein